MSSVRKQKFQNPTFITVSIGAIHIPDGDGDVA